MFESLSGKISSILLSITGNKEAEVASLLCDIKEALLESDVPLRIVGEFIASVEKEVGLLKPTKTSSLRDQITRLVYTKIITFLGGETTTFSFQIPSVVMVMGVQGSGKTTTVAKLAHYIKKEAEKRNKQRAILVASIDFYRPAAVDQLEIMAKKANVAFYRARSTDPIAAAREIYAEFKSNGYEILILDTAGRLHLDASLIAELQAVREIIQPKHSLLVLDAMTGQESLVIASQFNEKIGFQGAILTKLDSDARGGAAFSFRFAIKKPIVFVGIGEKIGDLQPFYPDRIAGRMLGMGDLKTLLERTEEKIQKEEENRIKESFMKGNFSLNDFVLQISMIERIGSLTHFAQYIPGVTKQVSREDLENGERMLKKYKVIISSMTQKERLNPRILDQSRTKRVAKGAGVGVEDVRLLLKRFDELQQYAKLFRKSGGLKQLFWS